MGTLRHDGSGTEHPLVARTLVGRSATCSLVVGSAPASGEHATVVWTPDGTWELKDLGSKNGTYLDGERVSAGVPEMLYEGAQVSFGDPADSWTLVDDTGPTAIAVDLESGLAVAAAGDLLVLPNDSSPLVSIYQDAGGAWLVESDGGDPAPARDQALIRAGEQTFRLHLPAPVEGTPLAQTDPRLENVSIEFVVSQNQEQVELRLSFFGKEVSFPPREHAYILLLLAKRRLEEADRPADQRGWIHRDDLLAMLRIDTNTLDVAVHRARRQFAKAGIKGAAGIVEVRRGQRRIGVDRLTVTQR